LRRHREFFRIRQLRRVYDRSQNRFTFNISYETAAKITPRSIAVAEAFGLGLDEEKRFVIYDNVELQVKPDDVVLITGDSGSGKSVLLRALLEDLGPEAVNMATVKVDPEQPLIETVGETVEEGLELLSRVGLNDAFLFLRTYNQLSDGQRYRYRVAKLIESGKQWWVMDEFCATLDRDTAKIVAFNVQKICRSMGKSLVVATTHMDLLDDLKPSVHIHKRFGKEISVGYFSNEPARECSLMSEMRVIEGTTKDWKELAGFHYRSHRICAPRKVFCLKRGEELCGVIVYCYPPPSAYGRRMVLPRMTMRELNEKLTIINRVVVHPKYRSIGLGAKLIRDTLPLTGTAYVEMVAVMAKYNPFAEKAGMKKVTEQEPQREILRVSKVLEQVGFNVQLLGSGNYVFQKLQALNIDELERVREAFVKADHPRFSKFFSSGLPFGHMGDYEKKVNAATLEQLAGLIKICGFLLQTKVYLFWSKTLNS
jgi:ABC-type lipoprotein export system ATPase subunit/GNAT superfamily N-acetyltransferase